MRRPWALPLAPFYRAAVAAHGAAYRLGLVTPHRLSAPVISVGSLSAGGAGKTPVVKMLAGLIREHGLAVDVLSRGYRRSGTTAEKVEPALLNAAARFGDEPVELARAGFEVFVGENRFTAGLLAESFSDPRLHSPIAHQTAACEENDRDRLGTGLIHLLDDGFQHRRLARQLDVVLLTQTDIEDHLLPTGNLREPLSALRRADVVLLRSDEPVSLAATVRLWSDAEIWYVERRLLLPAIRPARPFIVCAVARPEDFARMLRQVDVRAAGQRSIPDPHAYTEADIKALVRAARAAGADSFLTTAKDAVKLSQSLRNRLAAVGPTIIAELETRLTAPSRARLSHVLTRLTAPSDTLRT